jgi:hypothetical protein
MTRGNAGDISSFVNCLRRGHSIQNRIAICAHLAKDNIPLGYDIVEMPFVWISDGCDVPRPGQAWFKAGWLTLGAEQLAAWPPSSYSSLRGEVGAGPGVTLTDRQANPTTLAAPPTAEVGDMEGDAIAASQPVWPERSEGASLPPHSDGALAAPDVRVASPGGNSRCDGSGRTPERVDIHVSNNAVFGTYDAQPLFWHADKHRYESSRP